MKREWMDAIFCLKMSQLDRRKETEAHVADKR
jgi:hypothetical protein